ncbi:CDP-4-dehydro-6-deoxyglucose reductase [Paraburkholderia bannensis]|uniref:CDP-4-dehydro-6-deoxyglucose reductase n=1 Tax=Paraburkholderia bannensis TaxID=765414 RepID=A0A7W9U0J0_9BURK|nr:MULTISPECIES: CDP-6-deoxy-delta-3,4-glucoseen reductase [Paraburkholderia]MBB3259863.1 CDP-4-dehydro-6-deoxyglucose reductase [Paraburkholderia sp. WP4_3_2]MBB6104827.1 CDP-4-dehydro-6-deoxyglucose reductase [Paraburkholderia bannensis]
MSFNVVLKPSGHAFVVGEGKTILAAGLAAGNSLPYSCRTGVCNTCKGKVIEGSVDHGSVLATYLSESARAEGYALLCCAKPLTDLVVEVSELEGLAAIEPKIYPCRLVKLERPAPDVAVLTLRMPPNENMRYMAGQYVEMITANGERRCYSLAGAPDEEGLPFIQLHIRHIPGGLFTDHLFSTAKERDLFRFEGPFGTFFLREDSDKPMVLLASGTGFAPIKAIVEQSIKRNIKRPIHIYWGGRKRADIYAYEVAQRWELEHSHIRFVPVLSHATPECGWSGRLGFVHQIVMEDFADLSGHQVYACGAPAMVDAARADFTAHRGLPPDEFFADSFLTAVEKSGHTTALAE